MFSYHATFAAPGFLALLLLLPGLWWLGYRRLAGLGRFRRWFAIAFRTAVVVLLVMAAADLQLVRTNNDLTVIFVLDQSLSIPQQQRAAMIRYVKEEVHAHRRDKDRAGVIVFGGDAVVERPVWDDDLLMWTKVETPFDDQATNIAAALKLAQATFPEDAARRIVLVTDGNQNQGNAVPQAQAVAAAGIGLDVVPVRFHTRAEVAVERVILPGDVRRNEPFDVRVVLSNNCDVEKGSELIPRNGPKGASQKSVLTPFPRAAWDGNVPGKLTVSKIVNDQVVYSEEKHIVLPPGKSVFSFQQKIDSANFYTYEAKFVPDRPEDDAMPQNNRATAFTHVAGKGQVLMIVSSEPDAEHQREVREHELLADRLRRQGLEVAVRPADRLFSSLADLQVYDTVVLADVPRATSDQVGFSDEQIDMLVRNTQQMGAGLVMLGGPESFGAGGWTGTRLEEAMPVDFQIKNAEVVPRGALVLLMHASEIPQGNSLQKLIAKEAIKALSAQDYCGVMQWSGGETWIYKSGPVDMGQYRFGLLGAVDRMVPGDMPDFEPAMLLAEQGFTGLMKLSQPPAVKHMIVISDGDPGAAEEFHHRAAAGDGRDHLHRGCRRPRCRRKPEHGRHRRGGRRQILLRQAVAKRQGPPPHLPEGGPPRLPPAGLRRQSRLPSEAKDGRTRCSAGVDELPPITGYVLTNKKENPLVETVLLRQQARWRGQRHGPGRLELRPGPRRGLHHRRRPALDARLDQPPGLRQVLRPDHPLVDAALGRYGQVHHHLRAAGRADAGRRHRPGQQGRVPQLPHHDRHGHRPRPEEPNPAGDGADRAGPLRGQLRPRAIRAAIS